MVKGNAVLPSRWIRRSFLAAGIALGSSTDATPTDMADLDAETHRRSELASAGPSRGQLATTSLERYAGEFIEAFNSGPEALRRFEFASRANRWLAPDLVDSRLAAYAAQRRSLGTLDVHQVIPVAPYALGLIARSENTGEWLSVSLVSEPWDMGALSIARIDPAVL